MAEEQHLRFEVDHRLHGVGERERVAHAIAAHRHQVREVAEQRREHVADERDAVVGQPHDERVDRLAAGHADALEPPAAARRTRSVSSKTMSGSAGFASGGSSTSSPRAKPGWPITSAKKGSERRMRRPWMRTSSAWHAVMFACAMSCVSGLAEAVDAADVIGVTLREHDVARRRGADRVVVALVRAGLEPHAGVHDDATVVGGDRGSCSTCPASTRCRAPMSIAAGADAGPTAKKSGWLRTYSVVT